MNVTLKVWRQDGPSAAGRFETYQVDDAKEDMSYLENHDL